MTDKRKNLPAVLNPAAYEPDTASPRSRGWLRRFWDTYRTEGKGAPPLTQEQIKRAWAARPPLDDVKPAAPRSPADLSAPVDKPRLGKPRR